MNIETTYTRAVLVTGCDSRGNEFTYWQVGNEWMDGYNEVIVSAAHIANYVWNNITRVRFGFETMTRDEWLISGCPLEINSEQMAALQARHVEPLSSGKVLRVMEPETAGEMANAAYGQGVGRVIVTKEFAKRWTNNPQHYKDRFNADEVEMK